MAPVPGDSPETPVWHLDAARGPSTPSFNHLVGELQKVQRQVEAQRLRGLEINDEFEARRLHNGQVGGPLTLEYASNIDSLLLARLRYDPCCNSSGRQQ